MEQIVQDDDLWSPIGTRKGTESINIDWGRAWSISCIRRSLQHHDPDIQGPYTKRELLPIHPNFWIWIFCDVEEFVRQRRSSPSRYPDSFTGMRAAVIGFIDLVRLKKQIPSQRSRQRNSIHRLSRHEHKLSHSAMTGSGSRCDWARTIGQWTVWTVSRDLSKVRSAMSSLDYSDAST